MSKSDAQIKKDFDAFIEEIDRCTSESRARDILERYKQYCKDNGISLYDNYLVENGFAEALGMLCNRRGRDER